MAPVDIDSSGISPAGLRNKQAAALGYLLGVPLRPLATPPIVPAEKPLRIGQPVEPKITLGVPPAGMRRASTPGTVGTLGAALTPSESPLAARGGESLRALLPGNSDLMPTIGKPTRAESGAAGRREYAEGLPQVTAAPGTADYYHQKAARIEYENEHPRGSDISARPGLLGKIEHGLATFGNVVGDALIPQRMAEIPGTQLHRDVELANDIKLGQQADEAEQRRGLNDVRLGELRAETGAAKTRQELDQQKLANLRRGPGDKMLFHGVDDNGQAVVTFQRPNGSTYTVPAGYWPKGKTTGRGGSDFDRYYQGLVASGMADTPQNRLEARKDWEAAGRKPGSAGAKPPKLETVGAKRSQFATAKDRIQAQIANLNDQQARLGQGQGWRPAAQQKLAALQDEYRQASEQYDYWNGIYNGLSGGGRQIQAPRGMVTVQIPGHPVGHIPRSALSQFRKDHPDAKVVSQ